MNYYEIQDLYKKMFPGREIKVEFDKKCIGHYEIYFTDGKINPIQHIEYIKAKIVIEELNEIYVPINPHRENISWQAMFNSLEYIESH